MKAYNFGNIMEIIQRIDYKRIVFFHSEQDIHIVEKKPLWKIKLYGRLIDIIEFLYNKCQKIV